jgi:hypothetical protein
MGNVDLFRVAVVQAGSVPFDRERSTMKALDLTGQAIRNGARLIRMRRSLLLISIPEIAEGKFDLDVTGHYSRPDVFRLEVNEKAGF